MESMGSPLKEVLEKKAEGDEALLRVRAWEVDESPTVLGYVEVSGWPRPLGSWRLGYVAGVAVDSRGRYYLFHRGSEAPPLICLDEAGERLHSWGRGAFVRPHISKCDDDDNIWLIDDGGHVLHLFSPEGELLRTLGEKGVPGEDGSHFNRPTDIAFGQGGDLYVSDGYGNRRVARFDKGLSFLSQWGSEGEGKGQFVLPHAITTDPDGLVYVADRLKWRVEIFDPEGGFLRQWTHIGKPIGVVCAPDGCVYVLDRVNTRVTKVDRSGEIIGFFEVPGVGGERSMTAHDIAVASNGDILIAHSDGRAQLFRLS